METQYRTDQNEIEKNFFPRTESISSKIGGASGIEVARVVSGNGELVGIAILRHSRLAESSLNSITSWFSNDRRGFFYIGEP